jgi:glycosyltransferase involved in cell wall biosynthesis
MQTNRTILSILLISISLVTTTKSDRVSDPISKPQNEIYEKQIVVIIPSYNNLKNYEKNIDSVLMQKYENYNVIYIDDCSTDGMSEVISEYIEKHDTADRWFYVRNWHNCGALSNLYYAIHECPDNAIIVTLDGDDWLKHDRVLARVNEEYADENVWLTYGQFEWIENGSRGFCCALAPEILTDLRNVRWHNRFVSHLRTFYAWLFKKIDVTDLLYKGKFFPVAGDRAMLSPLIEMACPNHFKYIDEVLYVYNDMTGLNDHILYNQKQFDLSIYISNLPTYQPLDMESFERNVRAHQTNEAAAAELIFPADDSIEIFDMPGSICWR